MIEISAGGIVFNEHNHVLLINPKNSKNWTFPKGHLDNQSVEEAALREVKEESGIEAKIIAKVGESKYFYYQPEKGKIVKVVEFFLMEFLSGNISDHDEEVSEVKWVSVDEALKILTFKNDKELLKKAMEIREVRS